MVVVAFTPVKFCNVEEPVTRRFPSVPSPLKFKIEPKTLVEKRFVVVAEVPVAFTKVKF